MERIITAKYRGIAKDGSTIRRGDEVVYCDLTRKVITASPLKVAEYRSGSHYVSHEIVIGGRAYYRNKRGTCEDAPCCGCCTI
jgi:hypothetical protein